MEMNFIKEPELTFSDSGLILSSTQAVDLFKPYDENELNQPTLLNPVQNYNFYYGYHFDNANVHTTFGIPADQVEPLYQYLNEMAD